MTGPARIVLLRTARREELVAAADAVRAAHPGCRLAGYGAPEGGPDLAAAGCDPILLAPAGGLLAAAEIPPAARALRAGIAVVVTPHPMLDYENAYRAAARLAPRILRYDRGILEPLGVSAAWLRLREIVSRLARSLP